MNKLHKMLEEMCPTGVYRVRIDDLIASEQPTKYLVASKSYDDSYPTPVLTAGQSFLLGYTNEEHGKYPASLESPVIIFDDFTTAYKWVDFEFKVKSSAMKMLTIKPAAPITLRYFWYALSTIQIDTTEHARYWISKISNLEIPLPPLEIQSEIVRILDTFTKLEAELEAELEARMKQRTQVVSWLHSGKLPQLEGAVEVPLSDLVHFENGKPHEPFVDPLGDCELITSKFIASNGTLARRINSEDIRSKARVDDITIVLSDLPNGRALAKCYLVERDDFYAVNQRIAILRTKDNAIANPEYLYHFVNRNPQILKFDDGSTQTHLKKANVLDTMVLLPNLEVQVQLAQAMTALDKFVFGAKESLPAEIEARRQQYEHYRRKILLFNESAVA